MNLFYLFIFFFTVTCNSKLNNPPQNVNVIFYENGNQSVYTKNYNDLDSYLDSIFINTDDMLRLVVNAEYMKNIKNNNSAVEISFGETKTFQTKSYGQFKINKVFIPLSGDLAGTSGSPVVTLIISENNEYSGTAFRANNALNTLNEMVKFIKK
jgi:hypothetical protein